MAGYGYQRVQSPSLDVTDLAARDRALDQRDRAMDAQNQDRAFRRGMAQQPKFSSTGLKSPAREHYAVTANAMKELLQEKAEIDQMGMGADKNSKISQWNAKMDDLRLFTQSSNAWGARNAQVDQSFRYGQQNSKYTQEGINDYSGWSARYAEQVPLASKDGMITLNGQHWGSTGNVFSNKELPMTVGENLFMAATKGKSPEYFLETSGYGQKNMAQAKDAYIDQWYQKAIDSGRSEEEAALLRDNLGNYYSARGYYKPENEKEPTTYGGYSISGGLDVPERQMIDAIGRGEVNDGKMFVNTRGLGADYTTIKNVELGGEKRDVAIIDSVTLTPDGVDFITARVPKGGVGANSEGNLKDVTEWETVRIKGNEAQNAVDNAFHTRWKQVLPQVNWGGGQSKEDSKRTIKSSDIEAKAAAAGYTVKGYKEALKEAGVEIID